jgi:hypothetical protein
MVITSKSKEVMKINNGPEFTLGLYRHGGEHQYPVEPDTPWVHAWPCAQLAVKVAA